MDVFLGDNTGGMTAVARHLIEQHQYQRLCFLAGPKDAPDAAERRLAFEQAVAASPGSAIAQVIHGDFSEDSGIAAARTLLGRKSLPQAVVCANDQMAIGALRELQQAGVRVPADVAVTGFDDVHASRVIDPPLTTVSQPFRELGSRATRRLLARIDEPSLAPAVEVLPTQARHPCQLRLPAAATTIRPRLRPAPGRRCCMRSHLITQMWRGTSPRGARNGKTGKTAARLAAIAAVIALGPAAVLAAVIGAAPPASATTVPAPPSGWTTAYSDSFSGAAGTGVDSSWTYDTGTQYNGAGCTANYGTGEVESNTSSTANVSEDGSGHLNITAVKSGSSWTSGRIETTAGNFAAPAGGEMEVTASIKQPNPSSGLGYWPAFWMLGSGFRASGAGTSGTMTCSNWPSTGEIDIMEDVNALSEVAGTLHCGTGPGGPCNETTGQSSGLRACSGCQTGYNTYSVIVNRTNTSAESITYYLNGTAYYTVTESHGRHGGLAGRRRPRVLHHPRPRHGRRLPQRDLRLHLAVQLDQLGRVDERRLRRRLHHDRQRERRRRTGGAEPAAAASPAPRPRPSDISADCFSTSQGTVNVTTTTDTDPGGVDGNQAAQLANGNTLEYAGVNFGTTGSTQFDARVASGAAAGVSGLVEVVLDSPSNTPVGSFAVGNTGGWSTWETIPANITKVTGTHNVYLEFVSGPAATRPT